MLKPSLLTKLKKENNKIGALHSITKLFGKKELTSMHASQEHHTIYAANVSSKKDCSHCSSWFGAGALPLSHGKSPRELLATGDGGGGPAEPGHLPGSSQACLKGMVKWYWYLPIRNSLSYLSHSLS
jgi:hypothetical protein